MRIQFNIVPLPMPYIFGFTYEIVDQIGLSFRNLKLRHRDVHPPGLFVVWIQIHYYKYDIRQIIGGLAVKKQIFVVNLMKPDVPGGLPLLPWFRDRRGRSI